MHATTWFCTTCGASNDTSLGTCFACGRLRVEETREETGVEVLHDRYRLLKQVGTGGFGVVYQAIDIQNEERLVAVKQIHLRGLSSQKMIEATDAFNREVQLLSPLRHPNLPRIYDHFTDPDHWYLVMDYIDGETLERYLEHRHTKRAYTGNTFLPINEVLSIADQLCTVLAYLHSRHPSIIFRDLKPSNIMRARGGHLYLIDFGIARHFKPGQARDTTPFGSPGYAAPEQYGKAQTTPRADIYSLGALLHHLLTGEDPAETPFRFAPLSDTSLPEMQALDGLIARMVDVDSARRPASTGEIQQELRYIRYLSTRMGQRIWHPPQSQPLPPPWASGVLPTSGSMGQQQLQMQTGAFGATGAQKVRGRSRRKFLTRDLAGGFLGLVIAGSIGVALLNTVSESHSRQFTDHMPRESYQDNNHSRQVDTITWSPDGKMVALINVDGTVQIMKTTSNGIERGSTFDENDYNGIAASAWSPDNTRLALADFNGYVAIYQIDLSTGDPVVVVPGFAGSADVVADMAWSPDGEYIAVVGQYESLHVIDASNGSTIFTGENSVYSDSRSVAWSPDSKRIVTSGNFPNSQLFMQVWDVAQQRYLFSFGTIITRLVTWSPNGQYLASLDESSTITIWNASNRTSYRSFTALFDSQLQNQLIWSPDDKYLALSTAGEKLQVWDVAANTQFNYNLPPANMRAIAWLSNSKIIAIDDNQQIQIIPIGGTRA